MKIKTKDMILIALFAALTAVGAFIRIPIPYVPMTLQVFFVVLSGIVLGSKRAAMAQLIYVLVGLSGVPIFAAGGGIMYVLKPSFGYLIGFIIAAYLIGRLSEKFGELNFIKAMTSILPGIVAIYIVGVTYLYLILNAYMGQSKSVMWAIYNGCALFIASDLISGCMAAIIAVKVVKVLKSTTILAN